MSTVANGALQAMPTCPLVRMRRTPTELAEVAQTFPAHLPGCETLATMR